MANSKDAFVKQDKDVRAFLRKLRDGQVLCHAVWANDILERKDRTISEAEYEKLCRLGY
jgi:ribosomal protein L19E